MDWFRRGRWQWADEPTCWQAHRHRGPRHPQRREHPHLHSAGSRAATGTAPHAWLTQQRVAADPNAPAPGSDRPVAVRWIADCAGLGADTRDLRLRCQRVVCAPRAPKYRRTAPGASRLTGATGGAPRREDEVARVISLTPGAAVVSSIRERRRGQITSSVPAVAQTTPHGTAAALADDHQSGRRARPADSGPRQQVPSSPELGPPWAR